MVCNLDKCFATYDFNYKYLQINFYRVEHMLLKQQNSFSVLFASLGNFYIYLLNI